jgi:YVTN family beta-propeller protein
VTPIRTATNTAVKAIKVGPLPVAIAITPDGKTAYVVNSGASARSVTPIDTATNTALKAIPLGPGLPGPVAITPGGTTAYVLSTTFTTVTPIDIATNTALPAITVGSDPVAIAITP